jgi:hypothetical protein
MVSGVSIDPQLVFLSRGQSGLYLAGGAGGAGYLHTISTRASSSRSVTFALHASLCPGQAASWHALLQ